ncbi:MAG: ABC transporter ATP-binding protein [Geminicoccaceae bacterium]
MARVSLDKVNKIYGHGGRAVHAVQDLSLDIADGEFVALLGPSGCGKTSTLRMIVGLEDISGGTIAFDGDAVNDKTPEERNVAMAFESYALYPTFTIAQNLSFPLEVKGVSAAEREKQVKRIARLLRIDNLLERRPGELSGGQQQRVSLGRALIRDPAVFILDEVLSHLDAHLKLQMLFELKRIHQELGRTMIYVTHDQMEALALADRVAVMSNARLQQFGNRDLLYDRPVNRFVADFIGEPPTNFLDAEVDYRSDGMALRVTGSELRLFPDEPRAQAIAAQGLDHVTVGIRPQNLFYEDRPELGAFTATVVFNEYLGEQSILTVRAGEAELRAIVPPYVEDGDGAPVQLHYRAKDVMVFHPATEAFLG